MRGIGSVGGNYWINRSAAMYNGTQSEEVDSVSSDPIRSDSIPEVLVCNEQVLFKDEHTAARKT